MSNSAQLIYIPSAESLLSEFFFGLRMAHWLDWVQNTVQATTQRQPGDILLEEDRGVIPVSEKKFRLLQKNQLKRRVAAVDGGNCVLFESFGVSVHLLRVYGAVFDGENCTEQTVKEVIAIAQMVDEFHISVQLYGAETEVTFDKRLLAQGTGNPLTRAIGQLRATMEIATARNYIEKLDHEDLLLFDGSLVAVSAYDETLYEQLFETARDYHVLLFGFCKTTKLLCTSGISALTALHLIGPFNTKWFYYGTDGAPSTHFVRLHSRAKCCFRVDCLNYTEQELVDALEFLIGHCNDPSFLGYPYPLIKAHQRAKITPQEVKIKKALIFLKLGDLGERVRQASSGHDFLDVT